MTSAAELPPTVRVFVNERGVDVRRGGTALDAVRAAGGPEGDAVARGARTIVDSRGLPISPDTAAHAGAIYRTITARGSTAADDV